MEFYVGTSGWYYPWNLGGNFEWFAEYSGLNAVELNASFYRLPFPNTVKAWTRRSQGLKWSIKVNRLITHTFKFNDKAFNLWTKFRNLMKPLDSLVAFYLFQLPPSVTPKSASAIERFIGKTELGERFALEARNLTWYKPQWINWASNLSVTWVSVDSPDFPLEVFNTNGNVYERMHGRKAWYTHLYTEGELKEVAQKILDAKPNKAYVFFNNNHAMLTNSRQMLEIFTKMNK